MTPRVGSRIGYALACVGMILGGASLALYVGEGKTKYLAAAAVNGVCVGANLWLASFWRSQR